MFKSVAPGNIQGIPLVPLRRLSYVSTASPDLDLADIDAILAMSMRRNALSRVTGALFFNGANFLQVLEGGADVVRRTYVRIFADRRHAGVSMLTDEDAGERCYPEWAMQLNLSSEAGRDGWKGRLSSDPVSLPMIMPDHLRRIIDNFRALKG